MGIWLNADLLKKNWPNGLHRSYDLLSGSQIEQKILTNSNNFNLKKRLGSQKGSKCIFPFKDWEINPEVYGLRRSSRQRKEPTRLNIKDVSNMAVSLILFLVPSLFLLYCEAIVADYCVRIKEFESGL